MIAQGRLRKVALVGGTASLFAPAAITMIIAVALATAGLPMAVPAVVALLAVVLAAVGWSRL